MLDNMLLINELESDTLGNKFARDQLCWTYFVAVEYPGKLFGGD